MNSSSESKSFTSGYPLTTFSICCKDCFAADVGHVCRRDSVVGSQSWGQAQRREGRPRSAVGNEERERETRQAQNETERVNGVLLVLIIE